MADAKAAAASSMMHKRSSSGSSRSLSATMAAHASTSQHPFDPRPSFLDESALSAAEFVVYPQWLMTIKPSRSGEADHVDEQDALRFMREECGIGVHDEIKILSLFERFPLGLLPGHFYALLRLASWVQQGETPTKTLMFTQTSPPRISATNEAFSSASNGIAAGPHSAQRNITPSAPQIQTIAASPSSSPKNGRSVPPPPTLSSSQKNASGQAPLITVSSSSTDLLDQSALPPPVPDDSHKPVNPFRTPAPIGTGSSSNHVNGSIVPATTSHQTVQHQTRSAILGFDPAPNPFKQSKPKLVKPTPIVADASTPVVIRPTASAAVQPVDPFKSGQSVSSRGNSPVSNRSVLNASEAGGNHAGELKPPPLPPRHISPLIQAGLNARSQVRRAQDSLPPKTFTVLQSTQSRHPLEKPRLLTGQAAPAVPPPPPPQATKRRSITETRTSAPSVGGGVTITSSNIDTVHVPDRRSGPLPTPIAPKPSYGANRKTGVPAWLREQEELQRSSSHDHHNEPSEPPRDAHNRSVLAAGKRHKKRTASAAARIQFLDNDSDSDSSDEGADGTLSEQARSAASIDRNNPFFQHGRDHERSVDLNESLNKLAVENAVAKAEHDSRIEGRAMSDSSTTKADGLDKRPLGRSKTLRDGTRVMVPPAVPPRRRNEAFPATFNSGTYPGFGRSVRVEGPTMGGLRQTPISRKAEVGIPAHVLAEREKLEREKLERAATAPLQDESVAPLPPPRQRRSSSSTQVSASDGGMPLSPRDEMPPPIFPASYGKTHNTAGLTDTIKQEFDALAERHAWIARMAERAKGRPISEAHVGLMEEIAQEQESRNDDDEPEVDEHYLAEKRREQNRQWQRGNSIDVIREEEPQLNGNAGRRLPSTARGQGHHPSLSQRRATDSTRRTLSGAGAMANFVRRSSMLARGSFGAEDVVSSDTEDDEENDATPRREKSAMSFDTTPRKDVAGETKAPDVDAHSAHVSSYENGEHDRRQQGYQPLS